MRRAILAGATAVALLLGTAMLAVGVPLLATFGRDGTLSVESGRVAGDGAALVSDGDGVSAGPLQGRIGTLTLGARSADTPLFLGVAKADDVFAYLDGVPYDVVAEASPDRVIVRPVPGRSPAKAPQSQRFWVAQATGTNPVVDWPSGGEDYRFVVMNADGSPRVAATLVLGFRSGVVFPLGVTLVVVGAVLLLLGAVLAFRWWRRRRVGEPAVPPAAGAPAVPPADPGAAAAEDARPTPPAAG